MIFDKVEKIQSSVENVFCGLSAAIIGFMVVLTSVDVILRYLFRSPLPGVVDLTEMFMVAAVYPAVAYVQQKKGHIRVDIIIGKLVGPPRITVEISVLILSLIGFGMVVWQSGLYAWEAWISKDYTMGLMEYPTAPAKSALPIGVGLLCLRFITDIKNYFKELKKGSNHWIMLSIVTILPLVMLSLFLYYAGSAEWEPTNVGWIMLLIMTGLLLAGLPVAFSLLILGIIGYWIVAGPAKTLSMTGIAPYGTLASYTLSVIPLFILMGHLAYEGGFADALYTTAQKWIGHIPGSLAQATVVGGAAFGAACGSGLASCATLAKVCIPAMLKAGIDRSLAVGTVAAVGPIAQMIPPSITMVIYGVITDQSVGKLLIAGIIPGIIAAINFSILIYIRCKLNPNLAPSLPPTPWRERFISLKYSYGVAMISLIVMGGIWSGIFTPTEAGALGAFGAFVLGTITRKLKMEKFKEALLESTRTTAMIFLIIACALLFGYFLGVSRIPASLSEFLVGLEVPRLVILIGILVMYLIAGCFIDMLAFAFLTLPIIFPCIVALGYDPIWFGVIMTHEWEVALITPPFGFNLFLLRGMLPDMSMGDVIRGVWWFIAVDLITLAIYVAFPQVATWLPSMMFP